LSNLSSSSNPGAWHGEGNNNPQRRSEFEALSSFVEKQ
jgi:hypothetical protein